MKRKNAPTIQDTEPYTDEFIGRIAREFRIPREKIGMLKLYLSKAAWAYSLSLRAPTWAEQNWQTRKALEHVEATYSEFALAVTQLPSVARDHLWDPVWENPNRMRGFTGLANLSGIYEEESAFRRILDDFGKRITIRLRNEPNVVRRGGRPGLKPAKKTTEPPCCPSSPRRRRPVFPVDRGKGSCERPPQSKTTRRDCRQR